MTPPPSALPTLRTPSTQQALSRRTTASIEEIHIFTPRLANSFRLGYNRSVAIAPAVSRCSIPPSTIRRLAYYSGRSVGQLLVTSLTTVQGGSGAVGTTSPLQLVPTLRRRHLHHRQTHHHLRRKHRVRPEQRPRWRTPQRRVELRLHQQLPDQRPHLL